jgi:predicted metal-binding membrane protein
VVRFWLLDPKAILRRRATLGVELLVAISWSATIWMSRAGGAQPNAGTGRGAASMPGMMSMPGMRSMPGMAAMPGMAGGGHGSPQHAVLMGLPMWVAMSAAMMLPGALLAVDHVAAASGSSQRPAISAFVIVYLAVWAMFGLVVLGAVGVLGLPESIALAAALTVAAAWQLSPFKRRALREVHGSVRLPGSGWPAIRGAAGFGLRHGAACLRSCWALMLVMAVAPVGQMLIWMGALTLLVSAESLVWRPRSIVNTGSALLGASALVTLLIAVA